MKEFKSFYKQVGGNEGSKCRYNTRLDLYGCGCAHDCAYCYAKSLLSFRGFGTRRNQRWQTLQRWSARYLSSTPEPLYGWAA